MAARNQRQRVLRVVTDIRRLTATLQRWWTIDVGRYNREGLTKPEDTPYLWEQMLEQADALERHARELRYLARTNLGHF